MTARGTGTASRRRCGFFIFRAGFGRFLAAVLCIAVLPAAPLLFAQGAHDHGQGIVPLYGLLGSYPLEREASGTSWEPDSTPDEGIHFMRRQWMFMLHGFLFAGYDEQGGRRGGREFFVSNMVTFMGKRDLSGGALGFRAMLSLDPLNGKRGYPLLLQTGEAADGEPLIDRQHPHDLFSELSVGAYYPLTPESSLFAYAGLPGEPAIGPPVYVHRFTGIPNPEAPISHHWLDSTHIAFGVVTLGYVRNTLKLEGSVFRGREPDENRWDIEMPRLDSYSARFSLNPARNLSFQVSSGRLKEPEELEPGIDINRHTASFIYNRPAGSGNQALTVAWGMNDKAPGPELNAYLLESAFRFREAHTLFFRLEQVEKDELFREDEPLAGGIFRVTRASLGYSYDFFERRHFAFGFGGLVAVSVLPEALKTVYGDPAPLSLLVFLRGKIK